MSGRPATSLKTCCAFDGLTTLIPPTTRSVVGPGGAAFFLLGGSGCGLGEPPCVRRMVTVSAFVTRTSYPALYSRCASADAADCELYVERAVQVVLLGFLNSTR